MSDRCTDHAKQDCPDPLCTFLRLRNKAYTANSAAGVAQAKTDTCRKALDLAEAAADAAASQYADAFAAFSATPQYEVAWVQTGRPWTAFLSTPPSLSYRVWESLAEPRTKAAVVASLGKIGSAINSLADRGLVEWVMIPVTGERGE